MKSDMKAFMGLGLLCTVVNCTPLSAHADEVIYRTTETAAAPGLIVAPSSTVTTTTRTVETTPVNSILVAPGSSTFAVPVMADDTIQRRTVIVGDRPAASSSSSTEVVAVSGEGNPKYGERLRLLRQQLDNGTSKGWISADKSAELSSRLNALDSKEATVRSAGYMKVDCDSLEKDLTGFNIDLSHSMEGHTP